MYKEKCDAACIIENMMLEATNLGLGCCYIWGYLPKLRANSVLLKKLDLANEFLDFYEFESSITVEEKFQRYLQFGGMPDPIVWRTLYFRRQVRAEYTQARHKGQANAPSAILFPEMLPYNLR